MNSFKLIHLKTVDSTNTYAKNYVQEDKYNEPTIIIADTQTAGKTTKKTSWVSPVGNLYTSIILNLTQRELQNFHQMSFITTYSIVEVLKELFQNINLKIKWPNDLLLNNKKVAGILIEKEKNFGIIGIGINIISHPAQTLNYPATDLLYNKYKVEDLTNLSINITSKLIDNINLCRKSNFETIVNKVKPFLYMMREKVVFKTRDEIITGQFIGIGTNAEILIKVDDKTFSFIAGELTKDNFKE